MFGRQVNEDGALRTHPTLRNQWGSGTPSFNPPPISRNRRRGL